MRSFPDGRRKWLIAVGSPLNPIFSL